MKAVRGVEGGVAVIDLDEPPGIGELLQMRSASVCASDLSYITFGTRTVMGHELAGIREDGTAVVVEAIYGCLECEQCLSGAYNLCFTHGQRALITHRFPLIDAVEAFRTAADRASGAIRVVLEA